MREGTGRFRKGFSGNPRGRPKADYDLGELARVYTEDAIRTLVEIMHNGNKGAERVMAAKILLDRGYGRSPISLDFGSDLPPPTISITITSLSNGVKAAETFLPMPLSNMEVD